MLDNIPRGALWTPGSGTTTTDEREAARAVEAYDSKLLLGRREDTGEWIIFLREGESKLAVGKPLPVLGLGTRLPHPDDIVKRLYTTDTLKRGDKIQQEIMRRQDEAQAAATYEADEKAGVMAEAFDHGFRKQGAHPSPRVFIPRGVTSVEAS